MASECRSRESRLGADLRPALGPRVMHAEVRQQAQTWAVDACQLHQIALPSVKPRTNGAVFRFACSAAVQLPAIRAGEILDRLSRSTQNMPVVADDLCARFAE